MTQRRTILAATLLIAVPLTAMLAAPAPSFAGASPAYCGGSSDSPGDTLGLLAGLPTLPVTSNLGAIYAEYSVSGDQRLTPAQFAGGNTSVSGFGTSVASIDVNQDSCDDVVVGQPGTGTAKGSVSILLGSATGLYSTGLNLITGPNAGDGFGTAIAVSGRNNDPDTVYDLWIGAPDRSVNGEAGAGAVDHYTVDTAGTPKFLNTITADSTGVGGTVRTGAHFGAVLAAFANGENGANPGVAIGAPDDTVGGHAGAGSVTVVRINRTTGALSSGTVWTQDTPGVPGSAEAGDHFGAAITSDGLNMLVGVPGEDVGSIVDAGLVQTFFADAPTEAITQNSTGVPGAAEAGDHFGASVASGAWLLTQESKDFAIGAPGEDVGSVADAGSVTLLTYGDSGKVFAAKSLTQGSGGLGGAAEKGDQVGATLAVLRGDPSADEDTADQLFIGVPGEDIGTNKDAGVVTAYNHDRHWSIEFEGGLAGVHFGQVLGNLPGYRS